MSTNTKGDMANTGADMANVNDEDMSNTTGDDIDDVGVQMPADTSPTYL
jgi:hypothetical protein